MTAPRIVLDTNVLISAVVFGGKPREVLEKVIAGWFTMAISAEMLAEFQGVLEGKKFRYPAAIVRNIVSELVAVSELVRPTMKVEHIKADPADNRILECALESRAACIITGDRHLLELGEYEGIPILEVAAFLAVIECPFLHFLISLWSPDNSTIRNSLHSMFLRSLDKEHDSGL